MELIERLLFGSESLWGGGVAHSVLILALVVALGVMLGKLKVAGVSLGVTGILFVGIGFSYFGMNVDEHLMHFLKEFGLILFVYSIGLQVGPGFFSSFRKGGVTLNKLAVLVVALGVATTVALYYITGLSMTTMVGVMSGAVTNTPGLGAAIFFHCTSESPWTAGCVAVPEDFMVQILQKSDPGLKICIHQK